MALTKLSTDVIDLSGNTEALTIPKGATSDVSLTVEYLVVAGGGGGSSDSGGGAGAGGGGLLTNVGGTKLTLAVATSYTVTVGVGGSVKTNGTNSLLSGSGITTVESTGGGAGADSSGTNIGKDGGSGGGGTNANGTVTGAGGIGNAGPPRQGYNGGSGFIVAVNNGNNAAGGGGGAGAVGQNGASGNGGDGGIGLQNAITGTNTYYAGGGAGGTRSSGTAGTGGLGGGGDGITYSPYIAGAAQQGGINTGGGGGGSRSSPTSVGGSGVIILRYPNIFTATYTAGTGGAADSEVTIGNDKYIKITAGTGTVTFSGTPITSGRPTSPTEGLMRENTTTDKMEFYDGSLWQEINDTANSYSPVLIPSANFNTVIYTGTNTTQSISTVGFEPGMVWFKNRAGTNSHAIVDSVRTRSKYLYPDNTVAENTSAASNDMTSFNSNGFSLGVVSQAGSTNTTTGGTDNLVAWSWKGGGAATTIGAGTVGNDIASDVSANTDAGFSIVKYTGTLGAAGNIDVAHGLGAAPEIIISKSLTTTAAWRVRPFFLNSNPYNYLELNNNNAIANLNSSDGTMAMPTANVFSNNWNGSIGAAADIIAYCWRSIPGYSKIGFYVGNGSTTGPEIYTGFKPAFIIMKKTNDTSNWYVHDNKRNGSSGNVDGILFPNLSNAEDTSYNYIDFTSTGFVLKFTNSDYNTIGGTYIYMAFSE